MMNNLVRWYIKRFDAELDQVRFNTVRAQEEELEKILKSALTKYFHPQLKSGQHHKQSIAKLPVSNYADYEEGIKGLLSQSKIRVDYYAQSSGTSGSKKKLIPTPESFVKANHLRGSWYTLNILYNNVPDMNVFKAKNLLIGGAIYERHRDYLIGDVSGIMLNRIPSFFRPFYVPTITEAIQPDWSKKLEVTITKASQSNQVSLLAVVPTWVLAALSGIQSNIGQKKISQHWPDLKAYIHGGVSITPYLQQFKDLIDLPGFRFIEVYNATEGFLAIQDDPDQEGMLLMTKSGVYFEFVRLGDYPTTNLNEILHFEDVEVGEHYILLVSTRAGLIRYVMGDIIQFISLNPYRIKVIGRICEFVNAFGEDLMLWQAEEALFNVCKRYSSTIRHYTVAPKYISINEKGWHDWAIEFEIEPTSMEDFARALDIEIQSINNNYEQKRFESLAMENLNIYSLKEGTFNRYLKKVGKQGGQSKVKKLSNNREIMDIIVTI